MKIRYDLSCENVLWCKLDKNYFGFGGDVYLGNVYFPPEGSSRERRLKNEYFKQLRETSSKIQENKILIGDFNARTCGLEDTLTKEKHEDDIVHDFYSKIKSKRNNQDKIKNSYGKKLTEYCIATGSYIANGRTIGDVSGSLTCHQPGGSND